jgi:hypothetical protein
MSIRLGIDAEIDCALARYGQSKDYLTKIYWPAAFRWLVTSLLTSVFEKPDTWTELSTTQFTVKQENLQMLINELKVPTSTIIKYTQRRWIIHLLVQMSTLRRKFGLPTRLPTGPAVETAESAEWPIDLEDKEDLADSLAARSLRDDVKKYIWNILDDVVPTGYYCIMHYMGGIHSDEQYPIIIEVTSDFSERVRDRIDSISHHLRTFGAHNLLPIDLVVVKGVSRRTCVAELDGQDT